MEPAPTDPRVDYIGNLVVKTMKLKPEKWIRMMATEEYKKVIMEFLDTTMHSLLIISQNNAAQLSPATSFPVLLKNKGAYFVKKNKSIIGKTNVSHQIIYGDLATKPIEQLAILVDEIFVPLLSNQTTQKRWPGTVAQDLGQHVHTLRSTVYEVRGQVAGKTVLPLPVGLERVDQISKDLASGGEMIDLYLKASIEGVVIKWSSQIAEVIAEDSSKAFQNGLNPTPFAEINFWSSRNENLQYIYDQMKEDRVKKMALILEHTESAYYPCFKEIFANVVSALTEAKQVTLYLGPLVPHLTALQDADFTEVGPCFLPVVHTVCLIWSSCRHYRTSPRIIILLRQINNLIIEQARKYLDPSSIFQTDIDEALIRVETSIEALTHFRETFNEFRERLPTYFHDGATPHLWTFHPNVVFDRFNNFKERLVTIKKFYLTVLEFVKLERLEIGNVKGSVLSAQLTAISHQFSAYLTEFSTKSYDVLNPDDPTFQIDFENFQQNMSDLDKRLAAILCLAFDDCSNLEGVYKFQNYMRQMAKNMLGKPVSQVRLARITVDSLIEIIGTFLDRPLIKQEFDEKFKEVLKMLADELTCIEETFNEQVVKYRSKKKIDSDIHIPLTAGALCWIDMLTDRITYSVIKFKGLEHPISQCPEALELYRKYDGLLIRFKKLQEDVIDHWCSKVDEQIELNLRRSIISRNLAKTLILLNFHPQLDSILREVHYLQLKYFEKIPKSALDLYDKRDSYREYTFQLNVIIQWYNKMRRDSRIVEFELIQDKIEQIDELIHEGEYNMNWKSTELLDYIGKLKKLVEAVQDPLTKTQKNVITIRSLMETWVKIPLFTRFEGPNSLLYLEDKVDRIQKRFDEMRQIGSQVHELINENRLLLEIDNKQCCKAWNNYVDYLDGIISGSLLSTIGCSLAYVTEHMDPHNSLPPLLGVKLTLNEESVLNCEPPLDSTMEGCFTSNVQELLTDIVSMATLIPRVSTHKGEHYLEEIEENEDVREMKKEIMLSVQNVVEEVLDFCTGFESYSNLWIEDRELYMQNFLTYGRQLTIDEIEMNSLPDPHPPTMDMFKQQIDHFESVYTEIQKIKVLEVFNKWFQLDIQPFKTSLLSTVSLWAFMFKEYLLRHVTESLWELSTFIQEADEGLMQPVTEGDYTALVKVMGYLMQVKERIPTTDDMFGPLQDTIQLLKTYEMELPQEANVLLQELPEQWNSTKKLASNVKQQVSPLQAAEVVSIRKKITLFDIMQNRYREDFKKSEFLRFNCEEPYYRLDQESLKIQEYEEEMRQLQDSASLFELNIPEFKQLKQCRRELKMLKQLWDYISIVKTSIEDWKTTPWRKVDVENMDIECKKFAKDIRAFDKEMKSWDTYTTLEATVKNMLTSLKAVGELQNPAIRERHWHQLINSTKSLVSLPPQFTVEFVMDISTTLSDLLALNLHECEDEVKNIVDKAVKEMSMEKMLRELGTTWSALELEQEEHPRTGVVLLRASEQLIEILEENQVQLQNLITSKFIAHFLEEVSSWQSNLSLADQIITLWFEVQRTWTHLESIFMSSEDIKNQLPEDSERFYKMDFKFKDLLKDLRTVPNVLEATSRPNLLTELEFLQKELILCEKALAQYLETKRLKFPRFYFVSSADLLDILSNGNRPKFVARHMVKLFDSIASLKFTPEDVKDPTGALGMIAKDGEYVEFNAYCDCTGPVEVWLNGVQAAMRDSIKHNFAESMGAYEEKPRDQWLFDYPAQVSLCATQIWWSTEVNSAFSRLEEGYDNAMRDYHKKQISQLSTLITLLLGELSKQDRQKIMTICTIDVHSRDVVAKLIQSKVDSVAAFQWQSQLRHRWDEKVLDCFANICDAQFRYSHEYLGNTPRLVITPLTDRCYITLTQSLHLVMGGGPAGPAGTGKTETTKDLGRALGIMVYVFNCSEQMDYKSCGNIYKGLAQTGAWGCFDEFNRITVEVLSVVAVQVKSLQDAIREKKSTFNFMGEIISMVPTVGIFITMNPGYAGRTELPENLKALFRPCAMVVPDFELICEIMLVAEGFQEAKILARKFITLYTLCKELLSKQDHYDWGLRAIKSVLVVAGSLKRGDHGRPEEEVLMRALRDFNTPKIVTDDVPVFMGLIGDLFPALDVPRKRNADFEHTVKQAAMDLLLQPEDNFILKVVQLEELLEVRHSVFVVGNAGTSKTQVWRTLYKTYQNLKRKPIYNDLNPKAVTNDELFGIINPATREWKDGLFSNLMRDQANISGDQPKWIVLDGDIDPMWIESLNTVMDDNKVLTLASNERIALTPSMRLLFEISNLRTATPATVSRAGILYINPQDLGWNPYVTSWIETRENSIEKNALMMLFDKYIPSCLEGMRNRFKKMIPITEISQIQLLCSLLACLLIPVNTPTECPKEWYELYFAFACVWAFGSALFQDQAMDHRAEFSKWWLNEFKTVKFPAQGTVFDYYIDTETKEFTPWIEKVPRFELDADMPLQAVLVYTNESIRIRYFLDLLMENKHPVMLVGNAGVGKTVITADKLGSLPENYAITNVPFNFYTTSEMLQKILEKPLEKKAGRNYGPPGNKTMIYFIDDLNMPQVDTYGTVEPHTLIRQHLDYGHWYDRNKLTLKEIHNCQYIACMNPTAGSFTINPRLQRHFTVFTVSFPSAEALTTIYHSILSQHFANPEHRIPLTVSKLASNVVSASINLHNKVLQLFLPTASKFHYVFNLRDISNTFQGLLFSSYDCLNQPMDLIRLWMHETQRVYGDKLTDDKDVDAFSKIQVDIIKKNFEEVDESILFEKPNIYCHFAQGIGEPKYMAVKSWEHLDGLLQEALLSYNDLVAAMNLVLFEDAMMHVCRINRILESPRGSALLVGVGGSGKQSLSRLAAYISSLEVSQIQLKKGFGVSDLKTELSSLYMKSGMKNLGLMFLMTDAQVANEDFLVLINDMLASGEIPELFPDDEIDNIIAGVRNEVKGAGMVDTKENCWKFFIDRVRRQLRVVLCFSPVGSTLRIRGRKFPALINATNINWFHEWPQQALISVSMNFLKKLDVLPEVHCNSVAQFMAHVHGQVNQMSRLYLQYERRYNYTTPKSFLEQISLYSKLLIQKSKELAGKIDRLQNGLEKLKSTARQVDDLKAKLAVQEIELKVKNEAADKLIQIVGVETEKVSSEKAMADAEERKVGIIADEVSKKQQDCEEDLRKAEPALLAAQEALNTLNKANLTELKSFGSPPGAVTNVTAAVMVLLAPNGKIPKDRSWKAAKVTMAKVDSFLDALINYDKENIHPEITKAIQPYLKDEEFEPEFVRSKSGAAAGLCAWVINIIRFYEVYCDVEPKRKALEQANAELAAAQDKLSVIKSKVNSLEEQLKKLTEDFEKATAEKMKCQKEADATNETIQLANRLVGGLASENVRWAEAVASFMKQGTTLPGDILLITAFVSYVGCFTKQYRLDLLNKCWLPFLKTMEPAVPFTDGLDPLSLLTDDAQIAIWNNEGLPSDRMSTENATILTNSDRWPLMIDPQGIKWIKNKYGSQIIVLQAGQKGYLEALESALKNGDTVLLENISETLDPVLDPLLGRNLIKKGKAIKIGDKEVEFNSKFRLILHTKLANPHYKPEMQAQTTLINFTVTKDGLEDQLLAEVVKAERPDLEQLKAELTKQQNDFKIMLKDLEDDLLSRLSSAGGNLLGDTALVENLETTKKTAAEIEIKVNEAKITSAQIDQAREHYRLAAARASLLYFILNELNSINPIYQFSLKAFNVVFQNAIEKAVPSPDVPVRVENLIDCITYSVFMYTSRGLFECDKLIFISQMTFQILLKNGEISSTELDFFLRFPITPHVTSPVDFLSNISWGGIRTLSTKDEFRNLDRDIESSSKRWKKLVESECPEKEKLPQEWKNKTPIQRLCMMRALRPDRMTHAIKAFIEEKLGAKYVESRSIDFAKSFEESSASTPIFFILSPGVNPLKDVEELGRKLGFTTDSGNFHNVSLGQGQEIVAEDAMEEGSAKGHWVVLQNVHLVKKWLPALEKKLELLGMKAHTDFRVFLSAEPASSPSAHIIPQGILESSIKITNEPPTGIKANLHKALDNFSQETLELCSKEAEFKAILFSLCYFHAVVAERRKFGPQGWNKVYPFNVGDLNISVSVLYNYLEANSKVPWEDLRFLFGEIMYGGHITDDWDRRLCISYLEEFMQPELVDGELQLAPNFAAPPNLDYQGYHTYIDEAMPPESPYLYGLHPNAEIGFLTTTSEKLFRTVFEMQPRETGSSGGSTVTREEKVKQIIDEIIEKLPEEFNMTEIMGKVEERTPYVIVAFQECQRMNHLTGEMKRSLKELDLGLKGELTITSDMEDLENSLFLDQVPSIWTARAYPSLLGLTSWFIDLLLRLRELETWSTDFVLPSSVWLSGFFNPQSFLTAIMQSTARKTEQPLDKMCLQCDVSKKYKEEFMSPPREGAFVHGLFVEGGRWDLQQGIIMESRLKELFPAVPVINIRAIPQDKQDLRNVYECPVYKTRTRGPTYVWTFNLKTKEKPAKWTLAGVALLLQI